MATRLTPVFVGDTPDGDRIVLYKPELGHETYIKRPDGKVWAMGPKPVIDSWTSAFETLTHIKIQSDAWTGEATGSRKDLIEEPVLVQSYQQEEV